MAKSLNITSETKCLKRVIVHSPGEEIEAMKPSLAEESLYNDIIPLDIVKNEHAELKGFLSKVSEVIELKDLLCNVLESNDNRIKFVNLLLSLYGAAHRKDELLEMNNKQLANAAICGLRAKHISLDTFLKNKEFDIDPLPNMYFMRDAAMVYRNRSISSAMRFAVRRPEAAIHHFIFSNHPDFCGDGYLLDGPGLAREGFSIEGGDFQVLNKNTLIIGTSERTSPSGIDAIEKAIRKAFNESITIFAVALPIARATIHLDMTFTIIDDDACLVYEPVILGKNRSRVIRIDSEPGKDPVYSECDSLLSGLKQKGISLEPVLTGSTNSVWQEREQWLSGANSFSYAPGKILVYSCNNHTLDSLNNAGFEIACAKDIILGKRDPLQKGRLAVNFDGVELARGGGGARCMTCPIERE